MRELFLFHHLHLDEGQHHSEPVRFFRLLSEKNLDPNIAGGCAMAYAADKREDPEALAQDPIFKNLLAQESWQQHFIEYIEALRAQIASSGQGDENQRRWTAFLSSDSLLRKCDARVLGVDLFRAATLNPTNPFDKLYQRQGYPADFWERAALIRNLYHESLFDPIRLLADWSHDIKNLLSPVVGIRYLYPWPVETQKFFSLIEILATQLKQLKCSTLPDFLRYLDNDFLPGLESSLGSLGVNQKNYSPKHKNALDLILANTLEVQRRFIDFRRSIEGQQKVIENIPWNEIMDQAKAYSFSISLSVDFSYEVEPGLESYLFSANRTDLLRVLENLIKNSHEAMASPEQQEKKIKVVLRLLPLGGSDPHHLEIRYTDTGPGAPKDLLSHPVSTKGPGRGVGLGVVRDIVKENGGTISIVSTGPKGTCFLILIPSQA